MKKLEALHSLMDEIIVTYGGETMTLWDFATLQLGLHSHS